MYYLINNLPDELKMLIYNYIPINVKINLSKKIYINYYDEHYEHIKTILCKGVYRRFSFNTYVEKIIKKDLSFLFTNIIKK